MIREEFKALPYLLTPGQAVECGYALRTLDKYADYGLLTVVKPLGCSQRRFQKRQFAHLLEWEETLDYEAWQREKPLLGLAAVAQWTGYSREMLGVIVRAGGLLAVRLGGIGEAKYRKEEVGDWIGFNESGRETGKAVVKSGEPVAGTA